MMMIEQAPVFFSTSFFSPRDCPSLISEGWPPTLPPHTKLRRSSSPSLGSPARGRGEVLTSSLINLPYYHCRKAALVVKSHIVHALSCVLRGAGAEKRLVDEVASITHQWFITNFPQTHTLAGIIRAALPVSSGIVAVPPWALRLFLHSTTMDTSSQSIVSL